MDIYAGLLYFLKHLEIYLAQRDELLYNFNLSESDKKNLITKLNDSIQLYLIPSNRKPFLHIYNHDPDTNQDSSWDMDLGLNTNANANANAKPKAPYFKSHLSMHELYLECKLKYQMYFSRILITNGFLETMGSIISNTYIDLGCGPGYLSYGLKQLYHCKPVCVDKCHEVGFIERHRIDEFDSKIVEWLKLNNQNKAVDILLIDMPDDISYQIAQLVLLNQTLIYNGSLRHHNMTIQDESNKLIQYLKSNFTIDINKTQSLINSYRPFAYGDDGFVVLNKTYMN